MSTGRKIQLRGFTLAKDGKRVIRDQRRLDVSAQLKQQPGGSKRIRYGKGRKR